MDDTPQTSGNTITSPLKVTQTNTYSENNDPPLVDVKVTNPVTYFKKWIKRLLANEGLNIKFDFTVKPLTAIAMAVALASTGGIGFSIAQTFFPNSSPILRREVMYQGMIQKGESNKYYLTLPNSDLYALKPKANTNINFPNLNNGQALVKGNLTREAYVIDVSEIIPLGTPTISLPIDIVSKVNEPTPVSDAKLIELPKLYSDIKWETMEKKILLFTSGKRRIEQEGVYLESVQLSGLPQGFLNYYTQNLESLGFKQTFTSTEPNGITTTYAKGELFLTFGVKNIYQGSGDKKLLTGYKAYIEHN